MSSSKSESKAIGHLSISISSVSFLDAKLRQNYPEGDNINGYLCLIVRSFLNACYHTTSLLLEGEVSEMS